MSRCMKLFKYGLPRFLNPCLDNVDYKWNVRLNEGLPVKNRSIFEIPQASNYIKVEEKFAKIKTSIKHEYVKVKKNGRTHNFLTSGI